MKIIINLFVLLIASTTLANDLFKFSVPENIHLEGTYSSETTENGSFHLIIMKEKYKKVFKIKPVFIQDNNKITDFEEVSLTYEPTIISHHTSGDISSFVILNEKTKKLAVHNFNTNDHSHSSNEIDDIKAPSLTFRLADQTLLFDFEKKGKSINFYKITSDNTINHQEIIVPIELQDVTKEAMAAVAINQNEYVTKGTLNNVKAFVKNNKLFFSIDDEKNNKSEVLSIGLDEKATFSLKELHVSDSNIEKIKDYNSYLFDDKLYAIVAGKDDFELNLFDIESEQVLKTLSLKEDISKNNSLDNFTDYLDKVSKGRIRPTITANKTKKGNLKITIDQADITVYRYNYNWWWHHHIFQQQMMIQQEMMIRQQRQLMQSMPPGGFGPNMDYYDNHPEVYFKKEDLKPIVIIVDLSGNLLPQTDEETVHKNIDKEKNIELFEEDKNIKKLSACFSSSEMRYVYQDRKSKTVFIKTQPIKE
ncbi:hypothetical protein SCB49_00220 [unidentified eubacterium SCB49]|nr:hypothetical protein SCB49_00220 [unidentified eubacterium SCB49]